MKYGGEIEVRDCVVVDVVMREPFSAGFTVNTEINRQLQRFLAIVHARTGRIIQ